MRANPYEDGDPQTGTNNRILNAAAMLFYREGIRAVSVDQVAAEASVTKVTVYKHYCAKDELLAACLHALDERFFPGSSVRLRPARMIPAAACRPYSTSLTCGSARSIVTVLPDTSV